MFLETLSPLWITMGETMYIPLLWLVPSNKDCNGSRGSDIIGQDTFPLLQHIPKLGDPTVLFVSHSSIQWKAWHDGHWMLKDPREWQWVKEASVEGSMVDRQEVDREHTDAGNGL